jgi:hypothetical protein
MTIKNIIQVYIYCTYIKTRNDRELETKEKLGKRLSWFSLLMRSSLPFRTRKLAQISIIINGDEIKRNIVGGLSGRVAILHCNYTDEIIYDEIDRHVPKITAEISKTVEQAFPILNKIHGAPSGILQVLPMLRGEFRVPYKKQMPYKGKIYDVLVETGKVYIKLFGSENHTEMGSDSSFETIEDVCKIYYGKTN